METLDLGDMEVGLTVAIYKNKKRNGWISSFLYLRNLESGQVPVSKILKFELKLKKIANNIYDLPSVRQLILNAYLRLGPIL